MTTIRTKEISLLVVKQNMDSVKTDPRTGNIDIASVYISMLKMIGCRQDY